MFSTASNISLNAIISGDIIFSKVIWGNFVNFL